MSRAIYKLDGVDIKTYGVCVSDSKGIINRPKIKASKATQWDDYHGEIVDLTKKFYEAREITLSCFIKATSKMDFVNKVTTFERLFDKAGTNRLVVEVDANKPLIFEVYCKDEIDISKSWDDNLMIGTFKLKLTEPEPVKRVLRHRCTVGSDNRTCSIKISTTKLVNIFWGDGKVTYDVNGDNVTITHYYDALGVYFPVITGCIDEIENFETNAEIIWQRI